MNQDNNKPQAARPAFTASSGDLSFTMLCREFSEYASELYSDSLLLLFASEPPQEGETVQGACAFPDEKKHPAAIQLVASIMAQNKTVCSLLITAIEEFMTEKFGEDNGERFSQMLEDFLAEMKTRKRLQKREKEMSPDADRQ